MVTNLGHYQNSLQTKEALTRVLTGMESAVMGDFLAMDISQSLHYLGEITETITTDYLLDNIFSKFCIENLELTYLKLISEVVNQGSVQVQHSPTSTEFAQH